MEITRLVAARHSPTGRLLTAFYTRCCYCRALSCVPQEKRSTVIISSPLFTHFLCSHSYCRALSTAFVSKKGQLLLLPRRNYPFSFVLNATVLLRFRSSSINTSFVSYLAHVKLRLFLTLGACHIGLKKSTTQL